MTKGAKPAGDVETVKRGRQPDDIDQVRYGSGGEDSLGGRSGNSPSTCCGVNPRSSSFLRVFPRKSESLTPSTSCSWSGYADTLPSAVCTQHSPPGRGFLRSLMCDSVQLIALKKAVQMRRTAEYDEHCLGTTGPPLGEVIPSSFR